MDNLSKKPSTVLSYTSSTSKCFLLGFRSHSPRVLLRQSSKVRHLQHWWGQSREEAKEEPDSAESEGERAGMGFQ